MTYISSNNEKIPWSQILPTESQEEIQKVEEPATLKPVEGVAPISFKPKLKRIEGKNHTDETIDQNEIIHQNFFERVDFYKNNCMVLLPENGPLLASSLEIVKSSFFSLSENISTPLKAPMWLEIKGLKGAKVLLHIDFKKAEIGFLKPPNEKFKNYIHTFTDEQGAIATEIYTPIYTAYKVANGERLNSSDFLEKLAYLLNLSDENEIQNSIINYLNAKQIDLPNPEKAPLFYTRMTETTQNNEENLIDVALTLQGQITPEELSKFKDRRDFFENLDGLNQFLRKYDENPGFSQKNFLQSEIQKLDLKVHILKILGSDLQKKKALSEEELATLVDSLRSFEKLKQNNESQENTKRSFVEYNNVELEFPVPVEFKELTFKEQSSDTLEKASPENSNFKLDNVNQLMPLAEDVNQAQQIKDLENFTLELNQCQILLEDINQLSEGLKRLQKFINESRENGISESKILKDVATVMPLFKRDAFKSIEPSKLVSIKAELLDLNSFLLNTENRISDELSNSLVNVGEKHHFFIANALAGYLNFAIISKDTDSANEYPLFHLICELKKGVYLEDPLLQHKAARIASFYSEEMSIPQISPINTVLNLQEKPLQCELQNPDERIHDELIKKTEEMFLIETNKSTKDEYTKRWQKLDLMMQWNALANEGIKKFKRDGDELKEIMIKLVQRKKGCVKTHKSINDFLSGEDRENKDLKFEANLTNLLKKIEFLENREKLSEIENFMRNNHENSSKRNNYRLKLEDYHREIKLFQQTEEDYNKLKEKLKLVPIFSDINSEIPLNHTEFDGVISKLYNMISKKHNDMSLKFPDLLIKYEELFSQNHDQSAEKIEDLLKSVGIIKDVPKDVTEPTDKEIASFYLVSANLEERKNLLGDFYEHLNFAYRSIKIFEHKYLEPFIPAKECLGRNVSDKYLFDNKGLRSCVDKVLETYIKDKKSANLPSVAHAYFWIYGDHQNANQVANMDEKRTYSRSTSGLASVRKEFYDITSDRKDQLWKMVVFIAKHPEELISEEVYDYLLAYLYDFQTIQIHIDNDINGVSKLISEHIPNKIKNAISLFESNISNSELTNTERNQAAKSFGRLLLFSNRLKKYLEKTNMLVAEEKRVNLTNYQDYQAILFANLSKKPLADSFSESNLDEIAKDFFDNLSDEEILSVNKEMTIFYLAALHFKGVGKRSPEVERYFEALKKEDQYGRFILHIYFDSKVPEGLIFNLANQTLTYKERVVQLEKPFVSNSQKYDYNPDVFFKPRPIDTSQSNRRSETERSVFEEAIESLSLNQNIAPWYTKDVKFIEDFLLLTGKKIGVFNIVKNNGLYIIEGTPYFFNNTGEIFFGTKEGKSLKWLSDQINPLLQFNLSHHFEPEIGDKYFEDPISKNIIIYRNEKVTYRIANNGEVLIREKDGAIALKNEDNWKDTTWYLRNEKGELEAYSVENQNFRSEFIITRFLDKVRFESTQHPGFYQSKNKPVYNGTDLSEYFTGSMVFENEEGSQIILIENGVEFFIVNNKFSTQNPWDCLEFLLRAKNPSLTSALAGSIFLNPPVNNAQEMTLKKLDSAISTVPSKENFSSWLYFLNLHKVVRGNAGGLNWMEPKSVEAVINFYHEYKAQARLYPEIRVSDEAERLFLTECSNWFKKEETKLIKEIRNAKEEAKARKGSLSEKIATFLNLEPLSKENELIILREKYNQIFHPLTSKRYEQLQTGIEPKKIKSWSQFKTVQEAHDNELPNTFHEKVVNELENLNIQQLKNWETLKNDFIDYNTSKEDFVNIYIFDFYNLATTSSKNVRKELLDWLELSPNKNETCLWLSQVAKTPGRFPSLQKLKDNKNKFDIKIEALKTSIEALKKSSMIHAKSHWVGSKYFEELQKIADLEKEISSVQKKYEKDLISSFSTISSWRIVKKYVNMMSFYISGKKMLTKPLRIKESRLSRPYLTFKKSQPSADRSFISHIDEGFDSFFDKWKENILSISEKKAKDSQGLQSGQIDEINRAKIALEEYRGLEKGKEYSLKALNELNRFKSTLNDEIIACESHLKVLETTLLFQANQTTKNQEQLKKMLRGKELKWDDLVKLMDKNQEYAFKKHLADSSPEALKSLQEGFYQYLAIRTRLYQMDRIQNLLKTIDDAKPINLTTIQRLGELLSEQRSYDGTKPQDLTILFFEAVSPKGFYKKEQYKMINDLQGSEVMLAQMETGFGKTDYVLPLLMKRHEQIAIEKADKELETSFKEIKVPEKVVKKKSDVKQTALKLKNSLKIAFWPTANYAENTRQLSAKISNATKKNVQQLSFSRDSHLDSAQLELLLYRLERAAQKGDAVSVKTTDIASIQLHWIETLENISQNGGTKELLKCAEFYGKILQLLHTSSFATIDEAHDLLDPLQKTIYTLGEFSSIPDYAIDFASDFYEILLKNEAFKTLIKENKALTPQAVEQKLAEILNDSFLQELAKKIGLNNVDLTKLKSFLKEDGLIDDKWKQVDGAEKKLYLAKGYVSMILKATISGSVSEHFGLSHDHYDTCQYAIPYERKDIPKETNENPNPSTYQNIDEILLKTFRTYHTVGLTKANIIDLFNKMVANYQEEKKEFKKIQSTKSRAEYPSYIALDNLLKKIGVDNDAINTILLLADQEQVEARLIAMMDEKNLQRLSKDHQTIAAFIKQIVSPQIRIYPSSIGMTPQDLLDLFPNSISVTATPQEAKVHSLRTAFAAITGASGKLFDLLLTKTREIKLMPDEEKIFIEEIANGCKNRKVRAIADPSGLKRFDLDFVEEVANSLNAKQSGIDYIVFYDNIKKKFMRYNTQTKISQPFTLNTHHPEKTLTLYDQARSTGTDIFQMPDARQILLIAEATTSIQAGQGAGRMRQLDKAQELEVWTTFKPPEGEDANTKLLEQLITNNMQTSLHKNKVAMQQLMMADLKGALKRKMLGISSSKEKSQGMPTTPLNTDRMISDYKKYRPFFVDTPPYDPKQNYGLIGKPQSSLENLIKFQSSVVKMAEDNLGFFERQELIQKIQSYSFDQIPLPTHDIGMNNVGSSQEVSASSSMQQQAEASLQVEVEVKIEQNIKDNNFLWESEDNWVKTPKELYQIRFDQPARLEGRVKFHKLNEKQNELKSKTKNAMLPLKWILNLQIKKLEIQKQKWIEKLDQDSETTLKETDLNFDSKSVSKQITEKAHAQPSKMGAISNKNFEKTPSVRFARAKDALPIHLPNELSSGVNFFEDNFLLSSNYSEQFKNKPSPLVDSTKSKPLNEILLIQDTKQDGTLSYTGVAIDSYDSIRLHALFEQERQNKDTAIRNRKIAIVSIDMNVVVDQGSNLLTQEELNDPAVFALTAQAKLISGNANFLKEEKQYFKNKSGIVNKSEELKTHKKREQKELIQQEWQTVLKAMYYRFSPIDIRNKNRAVNIIDDNPR